MNMEISHKNTQIIQEILESYEAEIHLFLNDNTVEHFKIKALACAVLSEHYNVKTDGCTGKPKPYKPDSCPDYKPKPKLGLIRSLWAGLYATAKNWRTK